VLVNTVLTLAGKEEPKRTRTCLTLPNTKQTSSQRKENKKNSRRRTVTMASLLFLPNPARHLRNRMPGLHLKHYHMTPNQFRKRTSELKLP
jgi:hypothetical protein